MKQYLLSVHGTEGEAVPPADQVQAMYAAVDAFNQELRDSGAWVFAGGLEPPTTATTVRVQDGKALLTDGPFSESKEQLGGFWVVRAADLDAALELARRGAAACQGAVEVRPFQDEPEG
jgi:hypothetical protein